MFTNLIPLSESLKTRGIAVTYTSSETCSDACGLKVDPVTGKPGPCYAKTGNVKLHWTALDKGFRGSSGTARAYTFGALLAGLFGLPADRRLRLNVAGDLPGDNNAINSGALKMLSVAAGAKGRIAWTYTHKPIVPGAGGVDARTARNNAAAIRQAIRNGLAINASADTLSEADVKADMGFQIAAVLPESAKVDRHGIKTPAGRRVIVCPAVLDDSHRVTCGNCGGANRKPLCARMDRDYVIGFPAHGSRAKGASAVAEGATFKPAGRMLAMAH